MSSYVEQSRALLSGSLEARSVRRLTSASMPGYPGVVLILTELEVDHA
jgi:hypothetical protein